MSINVVLYYYINNWDHMHVPHGIRNPTRYCSVQVLTVYIPEINLVWLAPSSLPGTMAQRVLLYSY